MTPTQGIVADYVNLSKAGWNKAAIINELLTEELRGETLNEEARTAAEKTLASKSRPELINRAC